MLTAIRVDASTEIGTGHVMRCLTLAHRLADHEAEVIFISRDHPGNLSDYIESNGFKLHSLRAPVSGINARGEKPAVKDTQLSSWLGTSWQKDAQETINILKQEKARCLIVDHFGLDESWEKMVRNNVSVRVAVIDGQFNRRHDCDLLLDPNLSVDAGKRWAKLVPQGCQLFLGPEYSLLKPEFLNERASLKLRDGSIRKILIAFGGVDKYNATGMTLEAVSELNLDQAVADVVVGAGNPHQNELEKSCGSINNAFFHYDPPYLARLMAEADLALGAGGTMAWERCCLGLPSILMSVADNQIEVCRSLSRKGAAIYLGRQQEIGISTIAGSLNFAIMNPETIRRMQNISLRIFDNPGSGVDRFCKALLQ
jgi:UDP-2,4-diacetamido-2,4,6-trideoxy-beta-L-altropyranose hydrolase